MIARVAARMTQKELAAKAGVTNWTISQLENHYRPARALTRVRIADALGVDHDSLFPDQPLSA
jgi:transcriptional regulator with XRE-family HTH domain